MTEQWREITGYPNYEVSSEGCVRNRTTDRKIEGSLTSFGYRTVMLYSKEKRQRCYIHALVCAAWHGPRPSPLHHVRHLDGVPSHNVSHNLTWGTAAENRADTKRHGRNYEGARHHSAKLTREQVLEVRRRIAVETATSLAAEFGVTLQTLSRAVRGKTWKSVLLEQNSQPLTRRGQRHPDRDERIVALHRRNISYAEIARSVEVPKSVVKNVIYKHRRSA